MEELINSTNKITSLEIAELTGKRHADILRAIEKMQDAWVKIGQRNFTLTSYVDNSNRDKPMYKLSKTESLYIATKFNDVARAKVILRWEELELKNTKPLLSEIDLIIQSAQKLKFIQEKQLEQDQRIKFLEAKATTSPDYFTIAGYGKLNGIAVNIKMASKLGRIASKICKDKGYETDTIPDPRFGTVKMYPTKVLENVFNTSLV